MSAGESLARLRERKPLIHQITNYVVMNETANATLALGALPVMAHAPEEVEEMVGLAGALVLNIGTLSNHWVDAMIAAGRAANAGGVPVVLDPVGVGATRYRTDTAKRILDTVKVAVVRGNAGEVATLVGVEAEMRGVESIGAGAAGYGHRARGGALARPRRVGHRARRPRLRRRARGGDLERRSDDGRDHRNGMHVERAHGLLSRGRGLAVYDGAVEALVAFGVAGEDAAREAKGPGSFHVNLYDALAALDPATLDARALVS